MRGPPRVRGLLALLALLALSGPAVAAEAEEPTFRLALGPTSVLGRFSPEIADHFDARLEGIQDCAASIEGWQAPDPQGWVASFHTRSDERGKLLEFGWNSGHALPAAARRCVAKAVRSTPFPSLPEVGYLHVQQVVWVLPAVQGEAPLRDRPVADQLPLAELEAAIDPFRRELDECMLSNPDDRRSKQKRGRVVVWFALRPDGLVASTAIAGVNKPWVMHANCVATWMEKAEFEPSESAWPRFGGVRLDQANLFVPHRADPKNSPLPQVERFHVEVEPTGERTLHSPTVLPEVGPVDDRTAPLLDATGRYEGAPSIEYPPRVRDAGLEGAVSIVILVGVDGAPVRRADRQCKRWSAEAPDHWSWHRTACAAATAGPPELHQAALEGWVGLRFTPLEVAGVPSRHRIGAEVVFGLE